MSARKTTTSKVIDMISNKRLSKLLHVDLFGLNRIQPLSKNRYIFLIIDDYYRFTWIIFLKYKYETYYEFELFCKKIRNKKSSTIISIKSDHGREFETKSFAKFLEIMVLHIFLHFQ